MAIIYKDDQWANALQNIGSTLGQALQNRSKLQQQQDILKQIFGRSSSPITNISQQRAPSPIETFKASVTEEKTPQGEEITEKLSEDPLGSEASPLPQFNLPYSNEQRAAAAVFAPEVGKAMDTANQQALEAQKLQQKEQSEIRKEDRAEIKKYSEPFKDISNLKQTVNKLEKAKDLIVNRGVSLDQNQVKRLTTAILEDSGWDNIAKYFKTEPQKKLWALLKDYYSTKDIGGSNPSTKEVLLALGTLPSEDFGYESNLDLINTLLEDAKSKLFKGEEILSLRKSGKHYGYGEFLDRIEKSVDNKLSPIRQDHQKEVEVAKLSAQFRGKKPRQGYVFAISPDGEAGEIPIGKMKAWENVGGKIINDGRK